MAASTLAWLALIAAPLLLGRLVPGVALAVGAAVVLDVGEVVRQVGEARTGLALLAALVAVGHGAVVVPALLALLRPRWSDATGNLTPMYRGG